MVDASAEIHHLAFVEGAIIGPRTKVWQFASVIRGARLGADCTVGSGAKIDGATFGDRCIIGQNAALGPGLVCGNDVFIGPGVIVCNDAWPRVSKGGFDIDRLLNGFVTVLIEDGASVGAGAIVLPGVVIGSGAMVAAGSVVTANVPPNYLWKRQRRMTEIDTRSIGDRMPEAKCSS